MHKNATMLGKMAHGGRVEPKHLLFFFYSIRNMTRAEMIANHDSEVFDYAVPKQRLICLKSAVELARGRCF